MSVKKNINDQASSRRAALPRRMFDQRATNWKDFGRQQ